VDVESWPRKWRRGRRGGFARVQVMCSDPGQEQIKKDIKEFGLNRVWCACSPRMHEPPSAPAPGRAQSFLMLMANIREQCSWVTKDREQATAKAIAIVRATSDARSGCGRCSRDAPRSSQHARHRGGIAGIQAASTSRRRATRFTWSSATSRSAATCRAGQTFPPWTARLHLDPKMSRCPAPNIELLTYHEWKKCAAAWASSRSRCDARPPAWTTPSALAVASASPSAR